MKWGHPADVIADPKEKAEKHRRNVKIHTCRHKPDFSSSGGGVVPLPERADVHSYRQNLFWITLCYLRPYKIVPMASHSENLEWHEKFPQKHRVLSLPQFLLDKLSSEQPVSLLALLTLLWLQVFVCWPVNLRQEWTAVVAIFIEFYELAEESANWVEKTNWNKVNICSFLEILLHPNCRRATERATVIRQMLQFANFF